jgi:WD40 repeat protein
MQANRGQDPKSYPLNLALPPLASPTLLDRVQNKPDVEGGLRQIRKQRLKERGDAVYIQPQAKANIQASDDERFPLMERVNEFLGSNQKVFLLLGDSGAGKSTFNRQLECDLWNRYKKATGRVPLHISLPAIDKPEQDMIAKQLRKAEFTESEIRELKVHRKFILICDGYDESQQTHNLYMSNRLNQPGEWDAQMLISCRSEYLGSDYRDRFQPGDRNHRSDPGQFQEAVITPFTPDQVHDYIKQYVTVHQPLWETKEYEQALDIIPGLKDLVKNPFLMTLSLEVLPRMVDPGERLSATQITRVALYDQFIVHWLERGKKRLSEKELSSQAKAAFESLVDEGFTQNGIDFLKKLAVAIYKEQGGQPIVKYSRFKDEGTWKAEFFSRDDEKLLLREACPLTRSGNQYRFVHRSLLEYGLALAIHDPRDWKESTMPAAALGRRGSTSSAYSFNVDVATEEATAPIEQVPDITSPLSWRYFINEPSILQFLSERSQQEPIFRKLLLDYIEYSKTDEKWRKAAANAITILTRSGEKFHGADLSNIRIPGADLSYGMFDSANFQGADLRKVTLRGAWLRQVKLSQAQMSGVHFGELPFVKEDDSVWSCAYSPDGNLLAISLSNGDIKVYSTSMWELEHTLKGHDDEVGRVVFSPNGDHLLSGGLDCTARIWDVETESCIHTLTGHDEEVTCVAYSPEGDTIATASEDKTVRVWNASTGNCQFILIGHTSCTFSVAYSPNRCHIASGSGDRTVRIWDIETGACLHTLKGHEYQVRELAYSPQGDRIASGSDDKTLRLWDVETGTCCRIISAHGSAIYTLAYSLQGDVIACGGNDGTVQLWDPETGTCRQILTGHSLDVRCIVFSPKEGHIASASADSTVRLWEAGSGGSSQVPAGHMDGVLSVKYSPQGHRVASSGRDGTIRLWDVETGVCHQILASHTSWVSSIAFSPQGDIVVSAGHDGTLKMWDMGTGACLQTFTCHDETIETVAYSPRGDQVASGDISGSVQLWNVETGECRFILIGHEYRVAKVVYSPNGNHLASSGDHTVRLWSTESGDCLHALSGHEGSVNKIAFSPRGDLIASASDDQSVMLWEVDTGDCRAVLTGHDDEINSMAYSPSGDHIASGCNGGIVKLWSVATGDRLHDLTGHTDAISSIVFSLNGNELVTGGDDRAVRLWDVASGQCRAAIQDLNKYVVCIDWSPVSTTDCFVVGCGDGSVLRWQVIGEGDQRHVRMRWGSTNLFTAKDASIQGVSGLSQLNKRFLVQRGAVIEPLDRLREMSKLIGMVSVVSGFKQPSGLVPESVPSTRSSVE